MKRFSEEVIDGAKEIGCIVRALSSEVEVAIKNRLWNTYANGRHAGALWEYFAGEASIQDRNAWTWIGEFVRDTRTLMFFNDYSDTSMVEFDDGKCVVPTLAECTGFEFYLTNASADYVICFNHHDFIIAVGTAADWLNKRSTVESDRRNVNAATDPSE